MILFSISRFFYICHSNSPSSVCPMQHIKTAHTHNTVICHFVAVVEKEPNWYSIPFHFANAFTATFCSHVLDSHQLSEAQADHLLLLLLPSNLVSGKDSTIVCTPPHWHLSYDAVCHLWRLAAQRPCPVRKRFNIDHAERPRLKRESRIGSEVRFLLATQTGCHSSLHWDEVSAGNSIIIFLWWQVVVCMWGRNCLMRRPSCACQGQFLI